MVYYYHTIGSHETRKDILAIFFPTLVYYERGVMAGPKLAQIPKSMCVFIYLDGSN